MKARQILELLTESRLEYLQATYLKSIEGAIDGNGVAVGPESYLDDLAYADPTSRAGSPGKYSEWIVRQFLAAGKRQDPRSNRRESGVFMEDLYKVTEDLKVFDKIKHKLPVEKRDINKLTTTSLYDLVKPYAAQLEQDELDKAGGSIPGAEIVYQDDKAKVYHLLTHAAAVKLWRGTRWCTSADSSRGAATFADYRSGCELYAFIFADGAKYQISDTVNRGDGQFMDAEDREAMWHKMAEHDDSEEFAKFALSFDCIAQTAGELVYSTTAHLRREIE